MLACKLDPASSSNLNVLQWHRRSRKAPRRMFGRAHSIPGAPHRYPAPITYVRLLRVQRELLDDIFMQVSLSSPRRRNYKTQTPGRTYYDHVDEKSPSKTTWEMVLTKSFLCELSTALCYTLSALAKTPLVTTQVLQSQNAGAKPTEDDRKSKFKQMDNNGALLPMSPPPCVETYNWHMAGAFGRHCSSTHNRLFEPESRTGR